VITLLALTYDLRTFSEAIKLQNSREEPPGSRMQNNLPDGVATGRDVRDLGSTSFEGNVYPVQVDLTEWTRKFEEKFGDFKKLVDLRLKALDSLVKEKFDAINRRQNAAEKLTSTRFEEVKERFNQRLNDSKTDTEAQIKELETRIDDQCSRPTEIPDSSSSLRPTSKPVISTVTTPSDGWILIQKHNFKDESAFKNKLWEDYKYKFGDGLNEYWLGLKKMHDLTKDGRWKLKIEITYDRDEDGNPSSRRGKIGIGVWDNFYVASEEHHFRLDIGSLLEKENMGIDDPMQLHNGKIFSTVDQPESSQCAEAYGGGWWFVPCYHFCGNCQIIKDSTIWYYGLVYDGTWETPSDSAMWIKQEIDD